MGLVVGVGSGGVTIGRGGGGVGESPNLYEGALEGSNLVGSEVVGGFAIGAEIEGLILMKFRVVSLGLGGLGGRLGAGAGIIWRR